MNNQMNKCGIIIGNFPQFIDHIVPYCVLSAFPIVVSDNEIYQSIKEFYPNANVFLVSLKEFPFYIVEKYDEMVSCHWSADLEAFFFLPQELLKKQLKKIWIPHGNSDKGLNSYLPKQLEYESHIGYYGLRMKNFLSKNPKTIFEYLGNFRLKYYQSLTKNFEKKPSRVIPNALIAPTWIATKNKRTFFNYLHHLLLNIKKSFNCFVKLHPRTLKEDALVIQDLKNSFPETTFIENCPNIYPLLFQTDILISDLSSIAYDFLVFDRPIFFLNYQDYSSFTKDELYLHNAGTLIRDMHSISDEMISQLNNQDEKSDLRKKLYKEVFTDTVSE